MKAPAPLKERPCLIAHHGLPYFRSIYLCFWQEFTMAMRQAPVKHCNANIAECESYHAECQPTPRSNIGRIPSPSNPRLHDCCQMTKSWVISVFAPYIVANTLWASKVLRINFWLIPLWEYLDSMQTIAMTNCSKYVHFNHKYNLLPVVISQRAHFCLCDLK